MSVAFLPDSKQVVSGFNDKTVRLWDATTGALLQTLKGHTKSITSVAFLPNGKVVNTPLLVSNKWIIEKNVKILWLPLDY
jgi:WD40 repeat protein